MGRCGVKGIIAARALYPSVLLSDGLALLQFEIR